MLELRRDSPGPRCLTQTILTEPTSNHSILRWRRDGEPQHDSDALAEEEPLEIRARGRAISITMRTPGHDNELAVGFLITEGVIRQRSDVLQVEPCEKNEDGNIINVQLSADVYVDFARLTRHVFASSSCGLCGKATIAAVKSSVSAISVGDVRIDPTTLLSLPGVMRAQQKTFDRTGGLHAAAVFSADGKLIVLREDVGRHNAVDKVIGFGVLSEKGPFTRHVLLVSGRSSFEIMQKALAARIPIVAAVSAPSTLATDFARESGQTLVGFLRDDRFNVYANPERIFPVEC